MSREKKTKDKYNKKREREREREREIRDGTSESCCERMDRMSSDVCFSLMLLSANDKMESTGDLADAGKKEERERERERGRGRKN